MVLPLLIGTALAGVNLAMLVLVVAFVVRYLESLIAKLDDEPSFGNVTGILAVVLTVLFAGHLMQVATWALLFFFLGEFETFSKAFYHSMVNFTSLGYGDIVMSERWRLLGGLEAANGVLMFGLSAGTFLPVMNGLFGRRRRYSRVKDGIKHRN